MRRGHKTTELIVTVAANVAIFASAIGGVLPAKWAAIASAVSIASYNISRGMAKAGGAEAFQQLVDEPADTHTTPAT